jgi:hypothetical protein
MTFPPEWHALGREAELAAEQVASGVTILGRANHAQPARKIGDGSVFWPIYQRFGAADPNKAICTRGRPSGLSAIFRVVPETSSPCRPAFSDLLPFCYPIRRYEIEHAGTAAGLRGRLGPEILTKWYSIELVGMAEAEFQDRCLKPLGHPSPLTTSDS